MFSMTTRCRPSVVSSMIDSRRTSRATCQNAGAVFRTCCWRNHTEAVSSRKEPTVHAERSLVQPPCPRAAIRCTAQCRLCSDGFRRYIRHMSLPATDDPSSEVRTITVDGRVRRYLVHYPPTYNSSRQWPLVLSFHGSNSNGLIQLEFTGMNETADREGFVLVYPFGTGERERLLFWNAGNCCGTAHKEQV